MVKEPHPGRVKTRLGRDIGATTAAWWFRHSALALIRRLRDPRWQVILAVTPDHEGRASRVWPADLLRIPQGNGGLGERMARLLRAGPPGPVLMIGADIPGVGKAQIAQAFRALGQVDMVFGPARDGGFWLVGDRGLYPCPRTLFQNVRWSSETALSDTLAGLTDISVALVDTLSDVDTADDLQTIFPATFQ